MRIAELTAFHLATRLKKRIRHASHSRRANDTLVVRCRLADGTLGWGEGLPRPYVTGETIETAFEQLQATDLTGQLGSRIENLGDAVAVCDRFQLAGFEEDRRDCFGNAVRCAVELSLLDAICRAEGVSLSEVVPAIPETEAIRNVQPGVRYSGVITAMNRLSQSLRAWMLRCYGFQQTKVKVGVDGNDDAASLRRIRRMVGSAMDLRIDANEAWSCRDLPQKLAVLEPFGISAVEQPVPHDEVAGLATLRGDLPMPVMLDESLCSHRDAERAIEQGLCDLFNIRLSKCGGLIQSVKLAALAHRAGLGYQLGCQVGETGILSAAGRHFATSIAAIRYLEGSYDRFLVHEPLTREDLTFGRGGYGPALRGPGLGVRIDDRAVERLTRRRQSWQINAGD